MAVLKQIKFGSTSTPIAMTEVAIDSESSKVLSVVGTNTGVNVDANPVYTLAVAVDGTTITKTGNSGLATALKLTYHAAVTTGTPKGAYIALEDSAGNSIANSEIPVSNIIGNGVLDSSSYDSETGILTLTFKNADGSTTDVDVDLKEMFDIDDIIVDQTTAKDYLSFTLADPAAEEGQAVLGVKLADVTYTASSGNTPADLTVSTTNGKMLDASDAIPAIKGYVDDVVANASADLAVQAEGDTYVSASIDQNNNKKVIVATDVQALTATAGTVGTYNATTGAQTTAPVAGTLSGTADSLADGADIATKVKTYVDGAIAIEVARADAAITAAVYAEKTRAQAAEGELATIIGLTGNEGAREWTPTTNYGTADDTIYENVEAIDAQLKEISDEEIVISAALNDLDERVDAISTQLNGITYSITGTTLEFIGIPAAE